MLSVDLKYTVSCWSSILLKPRDTFHPNFKKIRTIEQVFKTGMEKKVKSNRQKNISIHQELFFYLGHPDHVDLARRQVCGPAEPECGTQLPTPPLGASPQTMKFFPVFHIRIYYIAKLFLYVEDFRTKFSSSLNTFFFMPYSCHCLTCIFAHTELQTLQYT